MTKLEKHFSKERDNLKTLKEIKSDIKKLLNDHWYELSKKGKEEKTKIIQEHKKVIEDNILENLKEWLKIIFWDHLYPLKYLTTYKTIFNFENNADIIFPEDILKLEWEDLIILRKWEKINIWKVIKKEIISEKEKNEINRKTELVLNNIEKINWIKNKDIIIFFSKLLGIKDNNWEITEELIIKIKSIQELIKDWVLWLNTIDNIIYNKNIRLDEIWIFLTREEKKHYKNIINNKYEKEYPEDIKNILSKARNHNFIKLTLWEQILFSTLKKVETKNVI